MSIPQTKHWIIYFFCSHSFTFQLSLVGRPAFFFDRRREFLQCAAKWTITIDPDVVENDILFLERLIQRSHKWSPGGCSCLKFFNKKVLKQLFCVPKCFPCGAQVLICICIQSVPKNAFSECCWSQSALAQSPFAGTPCVWRLIFLSFLTKTKQDQAPQSHVNGKIYPHSTQFWS